jgi:hypothetical protein
MVPMSSLQEIEMIENLFYLGIVSGPDRLTPDQRITQWKLLGLIMHSRAKLDPELLIGALAADAIYESQNILNPLMGKPAIAEYLRARFDFFREISRTRDIGRFVPGTVDLPAGSSYPCLFFEADEEHLALWVTKISKDHLIGRIDILTVAPHPTEARPLTLSERDSLRMDLESGYRRSN